jgi:hypothetical protein
MPEDRISKLSQRFKSHSVGRKPESTRNRERKSFYLDTDLAAQLDTTYKALNHELFPQAVSKSAFLETIIEYGLDHLPEVRDLLKQIPVSDPS